MTARRPGLTAALAGGRLTGDGAMGTQLLARGLRPGESSALWTLARPDDVIAVHAAYVGAGADFVTTNTFSASIAMLEMHGFAERCREINRVGAELARSAAGDRAWVLGDIGPFGGFLEPIGEKDPEAFRREAEVQVAGLAEGGVDAFLIETMADPAEVEVLAAACRAVAPDRPVFATYSFVKGIDGSFRTLMGTGVADLVRRTVDFGVDAVGANCGTGLSLADCEALASEICGASSGAAVVVQPNAGAPIEVDGRFVYAAGPEEFGRTARTCWEAGVRVFGGCCGTTPDHIAAANASRV
ncbi:MAG: homocysteine S-methyltransferase family protein [Fimbriimonadaceae bacterium]